MAATVSIIPYLLMIARMVVAFTFAISLVGKVRNLSSFEEAISRFEILPKWLDRSAAILFLSAELVVVILLLIGGKLLWLGFALAFFLLLVFSVALTSVIMRQIRTECNCFGSSNGIISPVHLWRNGGLLLCALTGWVIVSMGSTTPTITLLKASDLIFVGMLTLVVFVIKVGLNSITQPVRQTHRRERRN